MFNLLSVRLDTFHKVWGRRDPHRMVFGFTTTCAISAYHH